LEVFYEIQGKSQKNRRMLCCLGSRPAWLLSQGHTEEEALENIKDAIKTYLETVEELSKSI